MAVDVAICRTAWAGTSGGAGVTQLAIQAKSDPHSWNATEAQTVANAVRTFWAANPSTLSNDITLTVSPVVDIYNVISGDLVGSYSAATAPTGVVGTNAGSYMMASGAKMVLKTSSILNGRRVRGGFFIVPCAGDVFDANGQVSSTPRTNWVTAMTTLRSTLDTAGLELVVWSRPRPADHPLGARDGAVSTVTATEVPAKGAVLRGRRD